MGINLKGYDEVSTARIKLPAGGYVCKIMAGSIENRNGRPQITVNVDIAEGQFEGFFKRQYQERKAQSSDAPWPNSAVFKRYIFEEDGSRITRAFKVFLQAVESSNEDFKLDKSDFAVGSLFYRLCGFTFGEREYEYDGRLYLATEIRYPESVNDIRAGKFKMPGIKALGEVTLF